MASMVKNTRSDIAWSVPTVRIVVAFLVQLVHGAQDLQHTAFDEQRQRRTCTECHFPELPLRCDLIHEQQATQVVYRHTLGHGHGDPAVLVIGFILGVPVQPIEHHEHWRIVCAHNATQHRIVRSLDDLVAIFAGESEFERHVSIQRVKARTRKKPCGRRLLLR